MRGGEDYIKKNKEEKTKKEILCSPRRKGKRNIHKFIPCL